MMGSTEMVMKMMKQTAGSAQARLYNTFADQTLVFAASYNLSDLLR